MGVHDVRKAVFLELYGRQEGLNLGFLCSARGGTPGAPYIVIMHLERPQCLKRQSALGREMNKTHDIQHGLTRGKTSLKTCQALVIICERNAEINRKQETAN